MVLRYLAQHTTNDRAMAFEDITPNPRRLVIQEQSGTLTDTANAATGVVLAVARFGNNKIVGRINGAPTTPAEVSATTATTSNGKLTLGASGSTTNFARSSLRHFIVTQGATPHEMMQLEGWLAWDIGRPDLLDGQHPYRNVRP